MSVSAQPRALQQGDRVGEFDCGVVSLNNWFRTLAVKNQASGSSRTFVSAADDGTIAGYYSLSSFAITREQAGEVGAGMPDPIPATLIGRLAVDLRFRNTGLGASLLRDASLRAVQASLQVGSVAIIVHASEETVIPFYQRFGFKRLSGDHHTLYLPTTDAMSAIERIRNET